MIYPKRPTVDIDFSKAIPAAFNLLWASNLKKRKDGQDYRGNTYYLTATDIERQIRSFAQEQREGKKWGSSGEMRYDFVRIVGDLPNSVRAWLFAQCNAGKLDVHNFDRGHISGARFRPTGSPLYDAEAKTLEKKKQPYKPKPRHYSTSSKLLCMPARKATYRRSTSYTTRTIADVTCTRCLKHIQEQGIKQMTAAEIKKADGYDDE